MEFLDGHGHSLETIVNADKTELPLRGVISPPEIGGLKSRLTVGEPTRFLLRPSGDEIAYLFLAPSSDGFVYVITSEPIVASSARRVSKNNLIGVKP